MAVEAIIPTDAMPIDITPRATALKVPKFISQNGHRPIVDKLPVSTDKSKAPDVQIGGGSLLLAWQLKDKRVLIVGGGAVAAQRVESILATDALITVMCPAAGLSTRTKHLLHLNPDRVAHTAREFAGAEDLDGTSLVLTAIDDHGRSAEIVSLCRAVRVPVNAADIPELCDFYFGAQIRDGPLQIMISTNGNGPRMAAIIKQRLRAGLTGCEGDAITKIGMLRVLLRERFSEMNTAASARRMGWMTELCNKWELEDFTVLDQNMANRLLDEGFEKGRVPTLQEIGGVRPSQIRSWGISKASTPTSNAGLSAAIGFVVGALCAFGFIAQRQGKIFT